MWHDVKNIFHFLIAFQCLFFSIFLLSQRDAKKRKSNAFLAAFLLSILVIETGGIATHFLKMRGFIVAHFPQFYYIVYPFRYLSIPLFYLYVLSIAAKDRRIKKADVLHFALFLFMSVLVGFRILNGSSDAMRKTLQDFALFGDPEKSVYRLVEILQFLYYAAALLTTVRKTVSELKDQFSTIEQIHSAWMQFIVPGFIAWKSVLSIESFLWDRFQYAIPRPAYYVMYIFAEVVFLAFISLMFLKGLKQPSIFAAAPWNGSSTKYGKVLLSDSKKKEYKTRLLRCMETEKPYLNPLLCLRELSQKLAIPPCHLSQTLNTELKQNFFDFVNSFRIEESKRILSETPENDKTILEVLYETGFNSKSVFNTAFKKHTGMTPTEFRKRRNS